MTLAMKPCQNCGRELFGLPLPDSPLCCPCGVEYLWDEGRDWLADNFLCLKCGPDFPEIRPVPKDGTCPRCGWNFRDRSVYAKEARA